MLVTISRSRMRRAEPGHHSGSPAIANRAAPDVFLLRRLVPALVIALSGAVLAPASARSDGSSCLLLEAAAAKTCTAKIACAPHKGTTEALADALCACLRGQALAPEAEIAIQDALSAGTTAFACCAGNAISRRPELCERRG